MVAKSGAARIALQTACPVIPIGQWGAQDIMWGKKVHFPHLLPRKTLRLVAGPAVPLDDLRESTITPQAVAVATERIMVAITGPGGRAAKGAGTAGSLRSPAAPDRGRPGPRQTTGRPRREQSSGRDGLRIVGNRLRPGSQRCRPAGLDVGPEERGRRI